MGCIALQPRVEQGGDAALQSGAGAVPGQRQPAWVRVRAAMSRSAGVDEAA